MNNETKKVVGVPEDIFVFYSRFDKGMKKRTN